MYVCMYVYIHIRAVFVQVYIVGLAYDFCVGYTALDAKTCGFVTYVVDDCTRYMKKEKIKKMLTKCVRHSRNRNVCLCVLICRINACLHRSA